MGLCEINSSATCKTPYGVRESCQERMVKSKTRNGTRTGKAPLWFPERSIREPGPLLRARKFTDIARPS